jgi:hypothetical protein
MAFKTTYMTIHNRRTAPIRQTMSKILGGTALTFAMLLGFVNPLWALQVSPSALTFSATSGGTDPSPQTVVLSTNGSRERTWAATVDAPWITITPSSGTISTEKDTVSVRTTAAGLAAGSYSASVTITVTNQNGRIRRTILPVTLSVSGAVATPVIQLSQSSLTFSGIAGGANPAPTTFSISNTGGGTLTWTANDTAAWLTLSPASGTNTGTVTTSVNLTGLAAGTYNATVSVTATGATTKTIPVTLTLTAATLAPAIGLNTTSLGFAGAVGGTNPSAQSIAISNVGGGTLSWTASDNAAWLTLSPLSGTNSGSVTASVNLTGLAAGTYNAIITVAASGSTNSPQQIPVSLTLSVTAANTATLSWNASTESDLAGYKVYQGTGSGTYGAPITTLPKTTTSFTATGLQNGTTYFFVVTAYDNSGNESTYSNEVSKSIF